jgi:Tol biopolymer transport system component
MSSSLPIRIAIVALMVLIPAACRDNGVTPTVEPKEQLLFQSTRDGGIDILGRPVDDVYRMKADGTGAENLSRQPGVYSNFSVSPDGRQILYSTCYAIWVRNTDWSSPMKLTNRDGGAADGCSIGPHWSKDGTLIAFATNRDLRSVGTTSGLYDAYVMNADGSNPHKVSGELPAGLGFSLGVVGWSPDGQVVFQTNDFVNGKEYNRVYLVNVDGTGIHPLFAGDVDRNPAWSPDGSKIVFNRLVGGYDQVYVMNADGSGVRPLTTSTGWDRLNLSYDPWSPDGTRIVFKRIDATDYGTVYEINPDGLDLRRLTPAGSDFNGWAPRGDRIAFTSGPSGSPTDVYSVNADGTGVVNLTNHPAYDRNAMWLPRR